MRVSPATQGRSEQGELLVQVVDQRVDRGGVGRLLRMGRGNVVVREGVRCADLQPRRWRRSRSACSAHGVSSPCGLGEELLGLRAAHGARRGFDDDVLELEPVEDPDVGVAVRLVAVLEARVVDVEGVGVLHDELAARRARADAPRRGTLGLDLVDRERQVLVRRVQVLHHEREHLLVGGPEQVVVALAVLEPEDAVAVLRPAAGRLVGLPGQQRGERELLGADGVHLLADDPLDLAQRAQSERQPGVDAGCGAPDVARADEEPVARDLGVRGVLTQGPHEQLRHPENHGRKATCAIRCPTNQFRVGAQAPGRRRGAALIRGSCSGSRERDGLEAGAAGASRVGRHLEVAGEPRRAARRSPSPRRAGSTWVHRVGGAGQLRHAAAQDHLAVSGHQLGEAGRTPAWPGG